MRSKQNAINDIQKISGVGNIPAGAQDAYLLKLQKNKIDSDGWYIKIIKTGEEAWAFNSFDYGEGNLPEGTPNSNFIIFGRNTKVLVIRKGEKWQIIKGLENIKSMNLVPGMKKLKVGNSEIIITENRIDINTPELYINGTKV